MSASYNVLFLGTDNSARSILAESLVNDWGQGRFKGYSAGSFPKNEVHPSAVELLVRLGLPTDGIRSKSWDEFAKPGAPEMDFVITVCDQAAGEQCPDWPGTPITAHWGVADPLAVAGGRLEQAQAFRQAAAVLERRIISLLDVRLLLDRKTVEARVREIGRIGTDGDGKAYQDSAYSAPGLTRKLGAAR